MALKVAGNDVKSLLIGNGAGGTVPIKRVRVGTGTGTVQVWPLELFQSVTSSNTAGDSTTCAVALPPSRSVGDLVVILLGIYNGSLTTPSGWTLMFNDGSGARERLHAIYRVVDGTEGSSVTVTVSNSDSIGAVALLFCGQKATSPINASAQGGSTSNTTAHATPSVTTTSDAPASRALIVRAAATYVSSGGSPNYSWPAGEAVDFVAVTSGDSTVTALSVAVVPAGAVGAQGAVTATSGISRGYGSLTFAVSPR